MLKSIRFKNFKCFKDLEIQGLKQFNLIGGKNNVGKTALLEGIFIGVGHKRPGLALSLNTFRGIYEYEFNIEDIIEEIWGNYFYESILKDRIIIDSDCNECGKRRLEIEIISKKTKTASLKKEDLLGTFSGSTEPEEISQQVLQYSVFDNNNRKYKAEAFLENKELKFKDAAIRLPFELVFVPTFFRGDRAENVERLSKIQMAKKDNEIIDIVKIIEPKINQLKILSKGKSPFIYADIGLKKLMPIQTLGDGTVKLFSILLAIFRAKGGIVLIDELEDGFHHTLYEKVIQNIFEFAKSLNVQVITTTHNYELLQAAHRFFRNVPEYPFRYLRLDEIDGRIEAKTFDQEMMEVAMDEFLEVR